MVSTTTRDGMKIVLPRTGADAFWDKIHDHFAGRDPLKWKYLAMLALRENAGWPLDKISMVFGHDKGHISRCLKEIKQELQMQFSVDWDDRPDEGFSNPFRE